MARLSILVYFFMQSLWAQTTTCNKSNIYFVETPINAQRPQLGTFKYYYQYIKKADAFTPTIIVIPGGPGGTSIDLLPENPYFDVVQIQYGFIQQYNAILTDPRTRGCNQAGTSLPSKSFTSENVAQDIISIIKSLRLKNYIIYGHSYGTVVATLIGKKASDGVIPPPQAIIMSGTMGHFFKNHKNDVMPYYYKAWANVRSYLPEKIQKLFPLNKAWADADTTDQPSILGMPMKTWANFIFSNLTEGGVYLKGKLSHSLLSKLLLLDSQDESEILKLKNEVTLYAEPTQSTEPELDLKPFHDSIWCKELEQQESEICLAQNFSFDNPYDSKKFQLKNIPIIYIHGEFDPAVPMPMALYHYFNQLNQNKHFLIARDGGHATTMVISDCKEAFWRSIFNKAIGLENAVRSCFGVKMIKE